MPLSRGRLATKVLRRNFPTREDCSLRLNQPAFAEASEYVEGRQNADGTVEFWTTPAFTSIQKHPHEQQPRQIIWSSEINKLEWPLDSTRLLKENIVVGKHAAREYLQKTYYVLCADTPSASSSLSNKESRWCVKKSKMDIARMQNAAESISQKLQNAAASAGGSKDAKSGKSDGDGDADDDKVGDADNRGDGQGDVNRVGEPRSGQDLNTPAQKRARETAGGALIADASVPTSASAPPNPNSASSSTAAVVVPTAMAKFRSTVWSLHDMLVGLRTSTDAPSSEWLRSDEFNVLAQYIVNALASMQIVADEGPPPPSPDAPALEDSPGDGTDTDMDSDSS
jgi:hypothetical protein